MDIDADQTDTSRLGDADQKRRRLAANDPAVSPRKSKSRVTNGKSYFVDRRVERDGRGAWSCRWTDLYEQILAGMPAPVSEWQRQEVRRTATTFVLCEQMEGRIAAGEDVDPAQYGMLSDRLGRSLRRLGLKPSEPPDESPKERTLGQVLVEDWERQQREDFEKKQAAARGNEERGAA